MVTQILYETKSPGKLTSKPNVTVHLFRQNNNASFYKLKLNYNSQL